MALADTARLVASLELQDKFSKTADKFDSRIGNMNRHMQTFGRNVGIAAAAGIGLLGASVARGLQVLQELEEVTVATNAVIESTGGIAGVTAEEVRNLAEKYEGLNATMDDKVIQSAENLLLTFTGITEDAFEPALEAALNLNQAMGGGEEGLQNTIIQVGKALNDPIKGISALRRVGIQFSSTQEEQIRLLVEQNDLFGAQQVILGELETQFGGQFAAAGTTAAASFAKFKDVVEDTQAVLATAFLPVLVSVSDKLTELLADPAVQARIATLGEDLAEGFEALIEIAGNLPWSSIGAAFELMGTGAKALLTAFTALPPWVQTAVLTGWGLNKITGGLLTTVFSTLASGLIKGILGINAGVVNINAATVNGGVPGAGAPATGGGLGTAVAGVAGTAGVLAAIAGGFAALGDIGKNTEEGVTRGFTAISGGFAGLIARAVEEVVGDPLGQLVGASTGIKDGLNKVEAGTSKVSSQIVTDTRISQQQALARSRDEAQTRQQAKADALSQISQLSASNMKLQAIQGKNFSPTVRVGVTSNVSITDITRRLVTQRISIGGTGGITM